MACGGGVSLFFPWGDFADEALGVVDSAIQALAVEPADLDLDQVEPAGDASSISEQGRPSPSRSRAPRRRRLTTCPWRPSPSRLQNLILGTHRPAWTMVGM